MNTIGTQLRAPIDYIIGTEPMAVGDIDSSDGTSSRKKREEEQ